VTVDASWKQVAIELLARWRTAPREVCQSKLAWETDNFIGPDCPAYDEALRKGGATPQIDEVFPNPDPQPTALEAECERLRAANGPFVALLDDVRRDHESGLIRLSPTLLRRIEGLVAACLS
jgi:hypothetical protein